MPVQLIALLPIQLIGHIQAIKRIRSRNIMARQSLDLLITSHVPSFVSLAFPGRVG